MKRWLVSYAVRGDRFETEDEIVCIVIRKTTARQPSYNMLAYSPAFGGMLFVMPNQRRHYTAARGQSHAVGYR